MLCLFLKQKYSSAKIDNAAVDEKSHMCDNESSSVEESMLKSMKLMFSHLDLCGITFNYHDLCFKVIVVCNFYLCDASIRSSAHMKSDKHKIDLKMLQI